MVSNIYGVISFKIRGTRLYLKTVLTTYTRISRFLIIMTNYVYIHACHFILSTPIRICTENLHCVLVYEHGALLSISGKVDIINLMSHSDFMDRLIE